MTDPVFSPSANKKLTKVTRHDLENARHKLAVIIKTYPEWTEKLIPMFEKIETYIKECDTKQSVLDRVLSIADMPAAFAIPNALHSAIQN